MKGGKLAKLGKLAKQKTHGLKQQPQVGLDFLQGGLYYPGFNNSKRRITQSSRTRPSKFPQKKASRVDREKFVWQGFKDSLKGHKKGPPYLDDDAI